MARIIKENGLDPGPKRGEGTWHDFVQRHLRTLWACDFFCKPVWTLRGPIMYYVLFFIHIETRRVHVVGMTPNPNGTWMVERARELNEFFDQQGERRPRTSCGIGTASLRLSSAPSLESTGIQFFARPPAARPT